MGFLDDVGNLIGVDFDGSEARDAAIAAQTAATGQANAITKQMYDTQRADLAPYAQSGIGAVNDMQDREFKKDFTMKDFVTDPGYQFRMAEGMKAIERSAAARGGLRSGATMKALTRFAQDTAASEYQTAYDRFNADKDRRFSRMSSLANIGQSSAAGQANAAGNYGGAIAANQIGLGNAVASANIGAHNTMMNLVGQGGQAAGTYYGAKASDRRLKKNIVKVPIKTFNGIPTYIYEYKDEKHGLGKHMGVMAQDLLALDPKHPAVIQTNDGYMVDYSKLERVA